jgi:tetratricopeptide (TPR) repeat protein
LSRPEEGLALHRKAVELNPLSTISINNVGWDLLYFGRFDESLSWFKKALEVDPDDSTTLWSIGIYHWEVLGDYGEAVRWLRKAISADPGDPWVPEELSEIFMDLGDPDRAEHWIHRTIELSPESWIANIGMQWLHLYRGDEVASLDYGRKAIEVGQHWQGVLSFVWMADVESRAGRYSEARALYEENSPELLGEDAPNVNGSNLRGAISLASVLSRIGELERANLLLDRSFQFIQTRPRLGRPGYGIFDVKIYAVRGEKQKALSALRQAIDEGWRANWWYYLKYDPTLESLHDEPEYQAMIAEIEADMAAQLARVREMERNGELEPIPELAVE